MQTVPAEIADLDLYIPSEKMRGTRSWEEAKVGACQSDSIQSLPESQICTEQEKVAREISIQSVQSKNKDSLSPFVPSEEKFDRKNL